jgi:hypothetical protein
MSMSMSMSMSIVDVDRRCRSSMSMSMSIVDVDRRSSMWRVSTAPASRNPSPFLAGEAGGA